MIDSTHILEPVFQVMAGPAPGATEAPLFAGWENGKIAGKSSCSMSFWRRMAKMAFCLLDRLDVCRMPRILSARCLTEDTFAPGNAGRC